MSAYDFLPQFVPHIRSGRKRHTIRAERKYPDALGDPMSLYCGMRRRGCLLILRAPHTRREPIHIANLTLPMIWVNEIALTRDEIERLAYADGFESWAEMAEFWQDHHEVPWRGNILHWDYERRVLA